ncbi:SDR family NAD(P)-dependent oxidoreductase [Xanthobacter autotrophicus]|uniref:SDR family NAD(P)-dependent oxidoreductase n=1 Tax=Xanthobacter autotrophicus TaxID=280 RepID=UPI00372AD91C
MLQGTVIVTGASRGIGASIALELARRGLTVAALSRSGAPPERAEAAGEEVARRILSFACDVAHEGAMQEALARIRAETGSIGGLVNNAGIHREGRADSLTTADFEAVLQVNTTAVFAACRDVLPHMVENKRGIIVNIGSFFDRLGVRGSIAYCASKAAVAAMTRCMAAEWGRRGISVLNVAPGYILTDINRDFLESDPGRAQIMARSFVRRPGEPNEIARLVAALYSEDIPFLTGETIYVDGGHGISL